MCLFPNEKHLYYPHLLCHTVKIVVGCHLYYFQYMQRGVDRSMTHLNLV